MTTTRMTLMLLAACALVACERTENSGNGQGEADETPAVSDERSSSGRAMARLVATNGNRANGEVEFATVSGGVEVTATLTAVSPGRHGFHIHTVGDCSADDASSAKGHFNPGSKRHGAPDDAEHHAGDLGNVTADEDGRVRFRETFADLSLDGEKGIVGRAVILHSGADDFESQPSGDAGARVACGVIHPVAGDGNEAG